MNLAPTTTARCASGGIRSVQPLREFRQQENLPGRLRFGKQTLVKRRSPNAEEIAQFRSAIAGLGVTSKSTSLPPLTAIEASKGEVLMRPGDDPRVSGLVLSGATREYYVMPDGTERTRGFALPGQTYGSLSDALSQRPSRVFVRAEVKMSALQVDWADVEALARGSLEWERLASNLVRQLYLRKSLREYELLGLDAMGRYLSLREHSPALEATVSQAAIATYLGITPVHLSRLRRKLIEGRKRARR